MFPHLTRQSNVLCHTMNYIGIIVSINFLAMVIKNYHSFYCWRESLFLIHTNTVLPLFLIKSLGNTSKWVLLQNILFHHGKYMACFSIILPALWRGLYFGYGDLLSSEKNWLADFAFHKEWKGFSGSLLTLMTALPHAKNIYWLLVFTLALDYDASLATVTCLGVKSIWHILNIWVKWKILNALLFNCQMVLITKRVTIKSYFDIFNVNNDDIEYNVCQYAQSIMYECYSTVIWLKDSLKLITALFLKAKFEKNCLKSF